MRDHPYASALAPDMRAFLEFKAGVGVDGEAIAWNMWDLDRWCSANGVTELDRAAAEAYFRQRVGRTSTRQTSWVSYIREFARWLRLNGHVNAYVLPGDYRCRSERPIPYLLSQAEIDAFFEAAAVYDPPSPMAWEAGALFGLMHSCGLRTCEARRLRTCDVDLDGPSIDIMWSKGHRSRRLAVTDEVADMLARCGGRTDAEIGEDRAAFFCTGKGNRLGGAAVALAFRRIWSLAGLPEPASGRRATPYSFRHHFAYANIERWGREGTDVMAMLPYLARYMGHSSFDSTLYYVHTSPDFMGGFSSEASSLDSLLPEVGFDGQ